MKHTSLESPIQPIQVDLEQSYEVSPQKLEGISAQQFVDYCRYRIYTEYCCSHYRPHEMSLSDEEFLQWITDEIHYEVERRVNAGAEQNDELYAQVRIAVLRASVAKGVELFTSWGNKYYPNHNQLPPDPRNLRGPLQSYIASSDS